MREIKFRAWDKKNKKIVREFSINISKLKNISFLSILSWYWQVNKVKFGPQPDDLELMQFTGLKDRNGENIYEGDIVKCIHNNNTSAIRWEERLVEDIKTEETYLTAGFFLEEPSSCEFEVIGNIYENPDLLNK